MELIQSNEIPRIAFSFYAYKTDTNPDNLGIHILHFDQLKQVT